VPIRLDSIAAVKRLPPNKGMKQTKPAQAMELRTLSPVFYGPSVIDLMTDAP
jgi:hypothetical protein